MCKKYNKIANEFYYNHYIEMPLSRFEQKEKKSVRGADGTAET